MSRSLTTEPWSAGYDLVHGIDIFTHKDEAIIDEELLTALEGQFGRPVVGYIDGLHYQFKPTRAIPESSLALPEGNHPDDPEAFLVQR